MSLREIVTRARIPPYRVRSLYREWTRSRRLLLELAPIPMVTFPRKPAGQIPTDFSGFSVTVYSECGRARLWRGE
jgi:hypothetical protein